VPTNTPDQQLSLPVLADAANNPTAFTNFVAGVEQRLVRLYTSEADRTARMLTVSENELSGLAAEDRVEIYTGTTQISLYPRVFHTYKFRTVDSAAVNNSTVLVNDSVLFAPLPTTGRFQFEFTLFYDASTTADFKIAFTWPAAALTRWGVHAASTTVSGGVGPGVWGTAVASGTAITIGGSGTGTANVLMATVKGTTLMGGTAGNLQLQYAQATADPSDSFIRSDSRMMVWRVS
jgi:hypothetical protein